MSKRAIRNLLVSIAVVAVTAGGIVFLNRGSSSPADYAPGVAGKDVLIEVPTGATGSEIARLLFANGVVKSSVVFFQLAVVDKRATAIAPGSHRVQQRIPAKVALDQLLDNKRIPNLIKVTEGEWTDEIFAQLIAQGFTKDEIDKAVPRLRFPPGFGIDGIFPVGFTGLEGVFFPAQYSFAHGTSALTVLQAMMDRFAIEAKDSGLLAGSGSFSPRQLLTIASLAQAEGDPGDFAKISQVIRNRLKIGMPLQLDTTIHYIEQSRGQVFLSFEATKIHSLYNTYQNYGLPPGPIDNPGRSAMEAALHPEAGDWTYFITVKPGDTRFTSSNAQFLIWKSEYERNLAAGAFGKK
ncbi:MAG TPA: endolytic transglycosylase MltG [Candidatus Nanopelagicaceae bacterium]